MASLSAADPVLETGRADSRGAARTLHRPLLAGLVVFELLYYAYRYPLQINDSLTSATYRDTPTVLKVADDAVFLLVLAAVLLLKAGRGRLRFTRRHVFAAGAILLCFAHVVVGEGMEGPLKVKGVLLYSAMLVLLTASDLEALFGFLYRNIVRFFVLMLAVDALQIALFVALGRAPALAWSTDRSALFTQAVRFGSLWDDPNSYGLFLAIFFAWALLAPLSLPKRAALVAGTLAAAFFTWSRTCVVLLAFVLVLLLFVTGWRALGRRRFFAATARGLLLAATLAGGALGLPAAVRWAMQQESTRVHLDAVLLKQVHLSAVNLSAAAVQHSESVFTFVAGNAGWVPALLLFVLLALPLLPAIRGGKLTREHRILLVWGAVFLLSFFSIPFLWVAPMGFVYFLVYGRLLDLAGRRGGT